MTRGWRKLSSGRSADESAFSRDRPQPDVVRPHRNRGDLLRRESAADGEPAVQRGERAVIEAGAITQSATQAVKRQQRDQEIIRRPLLTEWAHRAEALRRPSLHPAARRETSTESRASVSRAGQSYGLRRAARAAAAGCRSRCPCGQNPDDDGTGWRRTVPQDKGGQCFTGRCRIVPRACRHRPAPHRSFRVVGYWEERAEPPWPLVLHPPRACVCRWAPDTETRIPAEPAPEGDAYWPWGCMT